MSKKAIALTSAGAVVLAGAALGVGSTMVMAPGTKAYGLDVGMSSPSAAYQKVSTAVANHEVMVDDQKFTLSELGYTVNQSEQDFNSYKAVSGKMNQTIPITVTLRDSSKAEQVLKNRISSISAPVSATVAYKEGKWSGVPGKSGHTIDIENLTTQLTKDLAQASTGTNLKTTEIQPDITDAMVTDAANQIEEAVSDAEFTVGENSIPIDKDVASSLITVKPDGKNFKVEAVRDKIDALAATVPAQVEKKVVNGEVVVDENGKVLKSLVKPVDGIKSASAADISKTISDQVLQTNFKFPVTTEVTTAKPVTKFRRAEVNLATNWAKFYENEALVHDMPVATGTDENPTDPGNFHVQSQLEIQDMGCGDPRFDYCTRGVQWISYYNADEGFHAAPWAKTVGLPSSKWSHGCVNMRTSDAEKVYNFLAVGSPVKVTR